MRTLSRRHVIVRAALAGLGLVPVALRAAAAHHGWSGYDSATVLRFTGPVREFVFANPHCMARVEAEGKLWECVLAPPSRMTNRGLPDGSIKVGDAVTVEGYPSRRVADEMRVERITVAGRTVELR
jgi:hypothetical protein